MELPLRLKRVKDEGECHVVRNAEADKESPIGITRAKLAIEFEAAICSHLRRVGSSPPPDKPALVTCA